MHPMRVVCASAYATIASRWMVILAERDSWWRPGRSLLSSGTLHARYGRAALGHAPEMRFDKGGSETVAYRSRGKPLWITP